MKMFAYLLGTLALLPMNIEASQKHGKVSPLNADEDFSAIKARVLVYTSVINQKNLCSSLCKGFQATIKKDCDIVCTNAELAKNISFIRKFMDLFCYCSSSLDSPKIISCLEAIIALAFDGNEHAKNFISVSIGENFHKFQQPYEDGKVNSIDVYSKILKYIGNPLLEDTLTSMRALSSYEDLDISNIADFQKRLNQTTANLKKLPEKLRSLLRQELEDSINKLDEIFKGEILLENLGLEQPVKAFWETLFEVGDTPERELERELNSRMIKSADLKNNF